MHLRPPSLPSTPSSQASPSTALTTPSPASLPRVLVPSGLRDVRIPVERIDAQLAARMVMTTLESVLYVKGQVPMSIQQMNFIGESGKNARAAKKRVELLQTLDILSSHLSTTFVQLSAALARRTTPLEEGETGRTHVLITLGPPSGLSKERVLLELEGLELKDWARLVEPESESESVSEEDDSNEEEEEEEDATSECSDLEASEDEESDERDQSEEREVSPTPQPELADSLSSASSSRESSLSPLNSPCPIRTQPPQRAPQRPPPDPARMLALALINLNQTSTPPTRVHLLLRAPRRFEHVSWEPRQNLTRALDGACFGFEGPVSKIKKSEPERVTVITSHPPSTPPPGPVPSTPPNSASEEEEDEPLWFEWTGKLQGFMEI
ncbi:hypothetical protein CALVIDRAFT_562983 [Calocera viscosa TUFC12733]|uniref:Uncharacterized protein n=1 Tax=Calocera viscosa (strain TUFC12733) TaxID=1330018 RepID=A0A167NF16_CALVF|nr:hypothetical protein CALVIDRAFT_562983 [Calocera viscosa TUFC12733]